MDFFFFVVRRGSENGVKIVVCYKYDGERKRMFSLLFEFLKYLFVELLYKALFQFVIFFRYYKEWKMFFMIIIDNKVFLNEFVRLVGFLYLFIDFVKTVRYRKGFRFGQGDALVVVFFGLLLELWRVLKVCVIVDKIILMQVVNIGLIEGSTLNGNDYDRDVVIISILRFDKLYVFGKGEQVLVYSGITFYSLEKVFKSLGRESYLVIGLSCIGVSVIGGICNNFGGSLV